MLEPRRRLLRSSIVSLAFELLPIYVPCLCAFDYPGLPDGRLDAFHQPMIERQPQVDLARLLLARHVAKLDRAEVRRIRLLLVPLERHDLARRRREVGIGRFDVAVEQGVPALLRPLRHRRNLGVVRSGSRNTPDRTRSASGQAQRRDAYRRRPPNLSPYSDIKTHKTPQTLDRREIHDS